MLCVANTFYTYTWRLRRCAHPLDGTRTLARGIVGTAACVLIAAVAGMVGAASVSALPLPRDIPDNWPHHYLGRLMFVRDSHGPQGPCAGWNCAGFAMPCDWGHRMYRVRSFSVDPDTWNSNPLGDRDSWPLPELSDTQMTLTFSQNGVSSATRYWVCYHEHSAFLDSPRSWVHRTVDIDRFCVGLPGSSTGGACSAVPNYIVHQWERDLAREHDEVIVFAPRWLVHGP